MGVHWFHLHWGIHGGEGYSASIVPEAPEYERKTAFNINLACLTKLGGCLSVCELYPEAAHYATRESIRRWRYRADDPLPPRGCLRR